MELPKIFSVLDASSEYPMKYYIFYRTPQGFHNTNLIRSYVEHDPPTDYQPSLEHTDCVYNGASYSLGYWNTGMSLVSAIDRIPVYEFETDLFTNTAGLQVPLIPVLPQTTNRIIQSKRKRIVYEQRASLLLGRVARTRVIHQQLHTINTLLDSLMSTPTEIVRSSVVENRPVPTASQFTLPRHVADAIVRALILDKSSCSITTGLFDEIPVIGITPCFHCFEYESLEKWLSGHSTCPECRGTVTSCMKYVRN